MHLKEYLNDRYLDAGTLAASYRDAKPFPSIVMPDFFRPEVLGVVADAFPDLAKIRSGKKEFRNQQEIKLACGDPSLFPRPIYELTNFLNSKCFLDYLRTLTGMERPLIPDPYFMGGGMHEIKRGGMLKIHADFNKHELLDLDRRLNLLIYLNRDWDESYGGAFELWDENMSRAVRSVLPRFNTAVLFSTTSTTHHGHPDPLTCPPDRSRRSIAIYYYTNGRPESEAATSPHSTLFRERPGEQFEPPARENRARRWMKKIFRSA